MRLETLLWSGVAVYFGVVGVNYLFVSDDPVGVTVLLSAAGLGACDATGIVGVYPTESLRPVALAVGTTALLVGIPLGSWLSMIGVAIIASQVMLLVHDLDT